MEKLLKVLKWILGCWFFIIGTAMLMYVSKTGALEPIIIVIFTYGCVFLMFETKSINKPLFGFSAAVVALSLAISELVLVPYGYEYKNGSVTWALVVACIGLPAMYWAYDKWDD